MRFALVAAMAVAACNVSPPGQCETASQCSTGEICSPAGVCVGCGLDTECGSFQVCNHSNRLCASACTQNNGGCSANAACAPALAGAALTCTCKIGFAGDGVTCDDIASELGGLRWDMPCVSSTDAAGCIVNGNPVVVTKTIGGDPARLYTIGLHFRGEVEPRPYFGGGNDGAFWQMGGDVPDRAEQLNIYSLQVSSPPQIYYLNRHTFVDFATYVIDYTKEVTVNGGATFTLTADPVDDIELQNRAPGNHVPQMVPGVPPAPQPYNGQFIQMDLVSLTAR